MKRLAPFILPILLLLASSAAADVVSCARATVRIRQQISETRWTTGTGVIYYADGERLLILTNNHVVARLQDRTAAIGDTATVEVWRSEKDCVKVEARVERRSFNKHFDRDLAILSAPSQQLAADLPKPVPFAVTLPKVGERFLTIGCPDGSIPNARYGRIEKVTRNTLVCVPGFKRGRSGSAVFDEKGEQVIGIVFASDKPEFGHYGYALHIVEVGRAMRGERARPDFVEVASVDQVASDEQPPLVPVQCQGGQCFPQQCGPYGCPPVIIGGGMPRTGGPFGGRQPQFIPPIEGSQPFNPWRQGGQGSDDNHEDGGDGDAGDDRQPWRGAPLPRPLPPEQSAPRPAPAPPGGASPPQQAQPRPCPPQKPIDLSPYAKRAELDALDRKLGKRIDGIDRSGQERHQELLDALTGYGQDIGQLKQSIDQQQLPDPAPQSPPTAQPSDGGFVNWAKSAVVGLGATLFATKTTGVLTLLGVPAVLAWPIAWLLKRRAKKRIDKTAAAHGIDLGPINEHMDELHGLVRTLSSAAAKVHAARQQAPPPVVEETSPPEPIIARVDRTINRFVNVPTADLEGEAYRESLRQEADLNPELAWLIDRIEKNKDHIKHGKQAAERLGLGTSKPGWKSN